MISLAIWHTKKSTWYWKEGNNRRISKINLKDRKRSKNNYKNKNKIRIAKAEIGQGRKKEKVKIEFLFKTNLMTKANLIKAIKTIIKGKIKQAKVGTSQITPQVRLRKEKGSCDSNISKRFMTTSLWAMINCKISSKK